MVSLPSVENDGFEDDGEHGVIGSFRLRRQDDGKKGDARSSRA